MIKLSKGDDIMRYCEKCGKPLEDNEICECEVESLETPRVVYKDPSKDMWKVILTAIIYPAIAIGISFSISSTLAGFGISVILAVAGALCIYFGGFTLLVIPLPIISLFWVNCLKKHLPLGRRILLAIGAVVFVVGSIVVASIL